MSVEIDPTAITNPGNRVGVGVSIAELVDLVTIQVLTKVDPTGQVSVASLQAQITALSARITALGG